MNACITRETFVTVFRRVFHSSMKLELCRHACRRRDPIISTCRYGKNMPTTALVTRFFFFFFVLAIGICCKNEECRSFQQFFTDTSFFPPSGNTVAIIIADHVRHVSTGWSNQLEYHKNELDSNMFFQHYLIEQTHFQNERSDWIWGSKDMSDFATSI